MLGRVGVRAADDLADVRQMRARGPHFLTGHQPLVAVAHGLGLHPGQVAARTGLAEELARHDVAAPQRLQVEGLHLVGGVRQDRRGHHAEADAVGGHGRGVEAGLQGVVEPLVVAGEAPAAVLGGAADPAEPGVEPALRPCPGRIELGVLLLQGALGEQRNLVRPLSPRLLHLDAGLGIRLQERQCGLLEFLYGDCVDHRALFHTFTSSSPSGVASRLCGAAGPTWVGLPGRLSGPLSVRLSVRFAVRNARRASRRTSRWAAQRTDEARFAAKPDWRGSRCGRTALMAYVLAVLAAFANALTSVLQRMGVETAPADTNLKLSLIRYALRRTVWIAGFLVMIAAFLLQFLALHFGHLTTVQPILTLELPFLVAILGIWFRQPLTWKEWVGAIAAAGGLPPSSRCRPRVGATRPPASTTGGS